MATTGESRGGAGGERSAFEMPTAWITAAGVAAVGLATAAFGGLAPATVTLQTAAPGAPVSNDFLTVVAEDAYTVNELPDHFLTPDEGSEVLLVRFTIRNNFSEPLRLREAADTLTGYVLGSARSQIQLDLPDIASMNAWRADGQNGAVLLQPGLPVTFEAAWEIPSEGIPDTLTVTLHEATMKHGTTLIDKTVRFVTTGDAVAQIFLPVHRGASS